jgi:hypothetical protein
MEGKGRHGQMIVNLKFHIEKFEVTVGHMSARRRYRQSTVRRQ